MIYYSPNITVKPWTYKLPVYLQAKGCVDDQGPIDSTCPCMVCKRYTRATLNRLLRSGTLGGQLVTYHNLAYMLRFMRTMRQVSDREGWLIGGRMMVGLRGWNYLYLVMLSTITTPILASSVHSPLLIMTWGPTDKGLTSIRS